MELADIMFGAAIIGGTMTTVTDLGEGVFCNTRNAAKTKEAQRRS